MGEYVLFRFENDRKIYALDGEFESINDLEKHYALDHLPSGFLKSEMTNDSLEMWFSRSNGDSIYCRFFIRQNGHTEDERAMPSDYLILELLGKGVAGHIELEDSIELSEPITGVFESLNSTKKVFEKEGYVLI